MPAMPQKTYGLGIIGFGSFGLFASQHFLQMDNVKLIGIAGSKREEATIAAKRYGATHFDTITQLLEQPELDIIYIASPPFVHHEQAMAALSKGKHVICEKPLAVTKAQADEMMALAKQHKLLLVTNLMQRYNPLFQKVKQLIDSGILGDVLHGYFENYASDEGLSESHWFWDPAKSGGIFIEHGVHFFDLFAGWLGPGKVESAQVSLRPGSKVEDQVNATVRYGPSLVNFYHGFTQVGRMDRQEMRILFEKGDITLHEWVPSRLVINAVVDEADTRQLMELFPGALDITTYYAGREREARGRWKTKDIWQKVRLSYGFGEEKMHIYGRLLRSMLQDQISFMEDPKHQRIITEKNGYDSLAIALAATKLAHQ